jgi:hypothetical protein
MEEDLSSDESAWIKLALLSKGVTLDAGFTAWFLGKKGFVTRRNFYNTPVWSEVDSGALPQEFRLGSVVVAANVYGDSPWQLTVEGDEPMLRNTVHSLAFPISMVEDLAALREDQDLARVCNLYGGSALSFFSPRACYFFSDSTECRFCSLAGTAQEQHDFASRLGPDEVSAAVAKVLDREADRINQIMIVGGNERDLDRGFDRQIELVRAAHRELRSHQLDRATSIHLATMPPRNLDLVDQLSEFEGMHVMFNLEVWREDLFPQIAPGKAQDYGRASMLAALQRLRSAIGDYRAHSILIAGLEPAEATIEGAQALADLGISPIVNVYHSDRHSRLGLSLRPAYRELAIVAQGLQKIHAAHPIQPYWRGCGRNSIDFEASLGQFRGDVPDWPA